MLLQLLLPKLKLVKIHTKLALVNILIHRKKNKKRPNYRMNTTCKTQV
ncbi:unnamed protein product [Wickerhamomyces anomalus]